MSIGGKLFHLTFWLVITLHWKTKYTRRCSVKNSTIDKEPVIFKLYFFVLKISKSLSGIISPLRNWDVFLVRDQFVPSCFIFLLFDMFVYKNKIYQTVHRKKLYRLPRKIMGRWHEKKRINLLPKTISILQRRNDTAQTFAYFQNKKSTV